MPFRLLLLSVFLLLLPSVARGQSFTSTQSGLSYVYSGGAHVLRMESEWLVDLSTGFYSFHALSFDVTVSLFTSVANYNNGVAQSTNMTNYAAQSGNWSYGPMSPTTGRLYGFREITLPQGYIVAVSILPKTSGDFTPAPTGPPGSSQSVVNPTPFVWGGQTSTLMVDLLHPGDD